MNKKHIGTDLAVVARTGAQLQKVMNENPFRDGYDISRVFFVSFTENPPAQKVKELLAQDFSPEALVITKNAAYLCIPGTYGRTTLSNNQYFTKEGTVPKKSPKTGVRAACGARAPVFGLLQAIS